MSCAMKLQLASDYEAATVVFSMAVAELRRNIGTSSKEKYEDLGRIETNAHLKSEQARLALKKHTAEHRC
jgi:hypothetical protein